MHNERLQHARKIIDMPEREMLGPRARRVQDLSSRCTLIEASNDDG